ncbi:MAG: hypothetical protein JG764_828 [Clostridiales bacterium]|jgi:hypothetical protein|nr:hypothetical protein [Clostridiales bacterium]
MGNEKHVLPDTDDTFVNRVKRGAMENRENEVKIIYGPDNRPLAKVNMEIGRELTEEKS